MSGMTISGYHPNLVYSNNVEEARIERRPELVPAVQRQAHVDVLMVDIENDETPAVERPLTPREPVLTAADFDSDDDRMDVD